MLQYKHKCNALIFMTPWKNSLITDFLFWSSRVLFIYYILKYLYTSRTAKRYWANIPGYLYSDHLLAIFSHPGLILVLGICFLVSCAFARIAIHICPEFPEKRTSVLVGSALWAHLFGSGKRHTTSLHPDHVTLLFLGIFNINQVSLSSHLSSIDFSSLFSLLKILL